MAERILSGVTSESFAKLQLGAGAIIKDFDYSSITDAAGFKTAFMAALQTDKNLGGTRGGIALNITPTTRKVEIDGTETTSFVGDEVVESWAMSMGASLVQFTPQSLQEAFPSSEFATVGADIVAMRIKQQFSTEDYATNHCWISSTAYGWLMVAFHNTLSMLSGEITTTSNGESVVPITITPKNADFTDIENLPVEIWIIDATGNTITTVPVTP